MRSTFYFFLLVLGLILLASGVKAAEGDLYDFLWLDPDKKVYVLQNKLHPKKGKFYADIGFIKGLSSTFQNTTGFTFKTGYYFSEEWSFELFANRYSNSDNDAFKSLQQVNQSIPFIRRFNYSLGGFIIWSPFYGKINTFNKIYYFDWYFGAGLGVLNTESNADNVSDPNAANIFFKEDNIALFLKSGLKLRFTKHWHIGFEYLNTSFRAPGPRVSGIPQEDSFRFNGDFIVNIGFSY